MGVRACSLVYDIASERKVKEEQEQQKSKAGDVSAGTRLRRMLALELDAIPELLLKSLKSHNK